MLLLVFATAGAGAATASTPSALARVEVWSDLACASGTRLAVVPPSTCVTSEAIEGASATDKLTLTVPRDATDAIAALSPRRIVRLQYEDGAFAEYRIQDIVTSGQARDVRVVAHGLLADLALSAEMVREVSNGRYTTTVEFSGSPTVILGDILAFAPSYFSVGAVPDPPNPLAVTITNQLPLAAVLALIEAITVATGTSYTASVRRVDTTGYAVDITALNEAASPVDVRTGKNVVTLQRTQSCRNFATRVYPVVTGGDGAAYFVLTNVTASYVVIAHIDGSTANPIIEDDALNGWYLAGASATEAVTDSERSTQRLYLADTSSFAIGDWVYLAASANGEPLRQVDYPSAQVTYGIQAIQLETKTPGFTNFVKNPDMVAWPTDGQPPTDWLDPGVWNDDAPVRSTTVFLRGGTSSRHYYDGVGYAPSIACQNAAMYVAPGDTITYTVWFRPETSTNGRAEWTMTLPDATTQALTLNKDVTAGEWYPVQAGYTVPATGGGMITAGAIGIAFLGNPQTMGAGAVDLYWDSAQIAVNATDSTFVRGSGGAQAWQRAVNYLLANTPPASTYQVSLLDLGRYDNGTWPFDALLLGGTVTITDDSLNVALSARITDIERNHLNPLATTVTIATRPATLTTLLVSGK